MYLVNLLWTPLNYFFQRSLSLTWEGVSEPKRTPWSRPWHLSVRISVCLSVCNTITFERRRKFIFGLRGYFQGRGLRVKFVYKSHRKSHKSHSRKPLKISYSRNVKIKSAYNAGSTKDRAVMFACMGFWDMADRMVWPPSLSRDWKCTH